MPDPVVAAGGESWRLPQLRGPATLCEGRVSPRCGPVDPGVAGLAAASEQHQAVEKVGKGRGSGPSAPCW